jgi:DNA-binding beta-propeller fold protein YncE
VQKNTIQSVVGIILPTIMVVLVGVASFASEQYELVTQWGSPGSGEGQFYEAMGLAIDSENNLYLADTHLNHRIQKFSSEGEFITSWGNYGSGEGEFIGPQGSDVDDEGNVYVADFLNDRVQKFTSDGVFITQWSTTVAETWQISTPNSLAVDNNGSVYVQHVSMTNPLFYTCIQKYTTDGSFIKRWEYVWLMSLEMVTDSEGNLYAPAHMIGPIQVFNSDGTLVDTLTTCSLTEVYCSHTGIEIDNEGNIYVSDFAHRNVKKFTPSGERIADWKLESPGGFGTEPFPTALAVDNEGYVYVVDISNDCIQKYGKVSDTTTTICPIENVYGEKSDETEYLRHFRDNILNKSPEGKAIVRLYQEWAPLVARAMEENQELKKEVRAMIDQILLLIR